MQAAKKTRKRPLFCVKPSLVLLSVLPFPLDLVHEVEVALIELVDTDVTVFSSTCVALAGRVCGDSVLRNSQ